MIYNFISFGTIANFDGINQSDLKTRKSCLNARGIPTAAYQVLHLLPEVGYPPPDRSTPQPGLTGDTRGGVPPIRVPPLGRSNGGVPPARFDGGYPPARSDGGYLTWLAGPGRSNPPPPAGVDWQSETITSRLVLRTRSVINVTTEMYQNVWSGRLTNSDVNS